MDAEVPRFTPQALPERLDARPHQVERRLRKSPSLPGSWGTQYCKLLSALAVAFRERW